MRDADYVSAARHRLGLTYARNARAVSFCKQLIDAERRPGCDGVLHHQRRDDLAPRRPERTWRRIASATLVLPPLMSRYCAA
jgi:hypothetical protein